VTRLVLELIIFMVGLVISYYSNSTVEATSEFAMNEIALSQTSIEEFSESLSNLVHQSQHLTKTYHEEIGKWIRKQYDDYTLANITKSFIIKFEYLTNTANKITYPNDYKYVHDAFIHSLTSETDSYKHFRIYLLSGNSTEDEISNELFAQAFQYEQIYLKFLSMHLPQTKNNLTKIDNSMEGKIL